MSEKLLPCPFCGNTKLESGGDDKFVGVRCLTCEATGPNHYRTGSDWGIRTPAPAVPACVLSTETKEALGVAISFFDDAIRKKNEAMAECQNMGQEIYVRNLFSQRKSLERHQLLIQHVVTGHPSCSAASTVEPVADFATEEQLRELFGEEDEPLADVINTHDGQWRSVGTCWRWHPYVESLSVPKVSIEPAAPTTSPEPDAVRDKIARIIDGRAFDNWQGQYDYAIKDNPAEFAQRCADAYYKEAKDTALEKADAVLAALSRPAHGGWEALAVECSECVIPRPEQMNIYRAHALLKRAAIALARNDRVTSQPVTFFGRRIDGGVK